MRPARRGKPLFAPPTNARSAVRLPAPLRVRGERGIPRGGRARLSHTRAAAAPVGNALPGDLLAAIKARFLASDLASAVTGGIFLEDAGRRASMPWIVAVEAGATPKFVTMQTQIHDTRIRFKLYAEDVELAGPLGDRLEDLFSACTLTFQNGWSSPWIRSDRRHMKDQRLSQAGNEVWYLQMEFTTRVKR